MYFCKIVQIAMSKKNFISEIEEKKELYGYQKGDIDKIFDRLDNAPSDLLPHLGAKVPGGHSFFYPGLHYYFFSFLHV